MKPVKENDLLVSLLAQTAKQDREAFAMLYERTSAKLFGILVRILGRTDSVEDILQDCYVTIWQKAGSFDRSIASPITWMAVIARNKAIDLKRRKSEKMSGEAVPLDENIPSMLADPERAAQRSEELEVLMACLHELPGEQRDMVMLAYVEGWSRRELGERFGRPVATVKTVLRRGLAALKGCLDG